LLIFPVLTPFNPFIPSRTISSSSVLILSFHLQQRLWSVLCPSWSSTIILSRFSMCTLRTTYPASHILHERIIILSDPSYFLIFSLYSTSCFTIFCSSSFCS
jgi:hypothetical protein